jgi:hypothetical protein
MHFMIQAAQGIRYNKDPFTDKPIMPQEVVDTPEQNRYIAEYLIRKAMTPIDQLARSRKGGNIQQRGPAGWNSWFRSIAGAVVKGPLNVFRGAGFQVVDLNRVAHSETLETTRKLTKKRYSILKQIRNEFADNGDIRLPDAVPEFYNQVVQEYAAIVQGQRPTTKVGKLLKEAEDRGISLQNEVFGSPAAKGSIRNMLISPQTWKWKYRNALRENVDREEMRNFTKTEREDMEATIKALDDIYIQQDFKTVPVGVRAELIKQILSIHGVDLGEFMTEGEAEPGTIPIESIP